MKRIAAVAVCAIAVALVGDSFIGASDPTNDPPCSSVRESKLRGAFMYNVRFNPTIAVQNGKRIAIKEAWIEKRLSRGPVLGLTSRAISGYNFCVTLEKSSDPASLYLAGRSGSFVALGTAISYHRLEKIDENYTLTCFVQPRSDSAIKIKGSIDRSGR